jgi:hypothetical protein
MLVIALIVLVLVILMLLWRWTTPVNPPPPRPNEVRPEHERNVDPIAEQHRQEQPWLGGSP